MTRAFLVSMTTLTLAGCVSVNPKPAFDDVGKTVQERTGHASRWVRNDEDAQAVQRRLKELVPGELSVEAAVEIALLNNPSLQATFEELGVAQADFAQASRLANPSLEVEALPPSAGYTEASIAQDLLDVLVQPLRKKIGAVQVEQVKQRVGDEMLRLVAETRTAFYSLQARQQLAGRLGLIVEIARTAAELAQRQHRAGNINDLDLSNHAAACEQAEVEYAQARAQVRTDRERLNRLMGLWGTYTAWTIGDKLPNIPSEEAALEGLEPLAIRRRFDVGAARYGVDLVGRALALKKGTRFFPVGLNVGVETEREPETHHRVTGPSLSIQLPLFDLGGASIARLEAQHRQAHRQLEAVAVNARSEVREARDHVIASRDQALLYRNVLLPRRVQIVEQTLRHYNFMLKGAFDLLLARQNEVNAERAYIEAWRDYWLGRTELERAIGGTLPSSESRNEESNRHESHGEEVKR